MIWYNINTVNTVKSAHILTLFSLAKQPRQGYYDPDIVLLCSYRILSLVKNKIIYILEFCLNLDNKINMYLTVTILWLYSEIQTLAQNMLLG